MDKLLAIDVGSSFNSPFGRDKTIGDVISIFLDSSFVIAGIIIFFMIIFAGYSLIAGAGSSSPDKTEKAKKAATSALIGFLIIFSAYWIIRIIELIAGVNFITESIL